MPIIQKRRPREPGPRCTPQVAQRVSASPSGRAASVHARPSGFARADDTAAAGTCARARAEHTLLSRVFALHDVSACVTADVRPRDERKTRYPFPPGRLERSKPTSRFLRLDRVAFKDDRPTCTARTPAPGLASETRTRSHAPSAFVFCRTVNACRRQRVGADARRGFERETFCLCQPKTVERLSFSSERVSPGKTKTIYTAPYRS